MTGLEAVAAMVGTVGGVALGVRTSRKWRQAVSGRLAADGPEIHIEVLQGQQRRWVVAAMELLAGYGTIDCTVSRRARLYQDIASSVDSRTERLEAHRQLLSLWIEVAALARTGSEATSAQAARVDRQLAALEAEIDQLHEVEAGHSP